MIKNVIKCNRCNECIGIKSESEDSSFNNQLSCASFFIKKCWVVKKMNDKYMNIAINEAKKAYLRDEIPVGCVIVYKGRIIAKSFNIKEKKKCAIYHAEIIAIKKACAKLKNWRLNECEMYVTMFPCPMCASAIKQSRISKVYYIVDNYNNSISKGIFCSNDLNKGVVVEKVNDNYNYIELVESFFQKNRNKVVEK